MRPETPRPGRARRRTGTVRFRITALAVVVTFVVLAGSGVALVAAQRHLLVRDLENALRQRADDLEELLATDRAPLRPGAVADDTATQVVTLDGEVVAASPNLGSGTGPIAPPPARGDDVLRTVEELPVDDDAFRVLSRRVQTPGGVRVLHVAGSLDEIGESGAVLRSLLVVAVPAVTALLAALVWWLVGRTLRPVEAIRAEVAGIGGSGLDRRVPEPDTDDEIARLARTMNEMLGRLDDAAQRQQRFVADASHELRSPLTRIRSEIEVDLAHPEGADPVATQRSVLEEAAALERLVDDLLHLARSDAGRSPVADDPVDLDDIVLRHAARLRAAGHPEVEASDLTAVRVRGDAAALDRAVGNLVDNAARHAGATVVLTLAERDGAAVFAVADDGPGIPADRHELVFERFARLDDARNRSTGGTGLGLAIAREIARRHGGDIRVDGEHAGGARLVLTLPVDRRG
jgi:signal transduction histidine kinase